jgi:hypothetical protein
MRTLRLSRRTVVRGLVGGGAVTVGLPPLEAMFNGNGTALADGSALPRRLGVFFWGNGVRLANWTPAATGPDYPLSRSLMALAPVRKYVNLVSGMDIKIPASQGHHTGTVGILSGAPLISQPKGTAAFRSTFSKPSVDQIAAAELGKLTQFKSLEVGVSRRLNRSEGTTLWYLSHNGPDSPNPPIYAPADVFKRLFGGGDPSGAAPGVAPEKIALLRKSVLDGVIADLNRLKTRASTADRTRLDQHLDNVRGIEKRLTPAGGGTARAGGTCTVPKAPGTFPDTAQGEQLEPIMSAMSDLIAVALACDQTRVFSVMFSGSVCSTVYWQVDVHGGHHSLTHDEPGDQPQIQAATEFTMKMFGLLLQALANTPEGAGNLLDNSAIVASSDTAEGRAHSIRDYPIVVGGRGGGFLKSPGVHYRSKGENTSTVLLSLLHAAGVNAAGFGDGTGRATTGCTAIEA